MGCFSSSTFGVPSGSCCLRFPDRFNFLTTGVELCAYRALPASGETVMGRDCVLIPRGVDKASLCGTEIGVAGWS